jgi:hypothetical protein
MREEKTKMKMGAQQAGMGVQTASRKHMRTQAVGLRAHWSGSWVMGID